MSIALPRINVSTIIGGLLLFCIHQVTKETIAIKNLNRAHLFESASHCSNRADIHPLVVSNSSEYTWIGNTFIPPKGVPTFQGKDYHSYFAKQNTLFLGDSTGRRAYGTIFGIINHIDLLNIPAKALDDPAVIDVGKGVRNFQGCLIPGRHLLNDTDYGYGFICRDIEETNNSTNKNEIKKIGSNKHKGRFDYMRLVCIDSLIDLFNTTYSETFVDYDLIVINVGIWTATMPKACPLMPRLPTLTNANKYDIILDVMMKNINPNNKIVFRTPGFQGGHTGDHIIWEMINSIKEYSKKLVNNYGKFIVVDFGTVISKRSFGLDRLSADIPAHYNLEGRMLFAQQLLHELLASEEQYG